MARLKLTYSLYARKTVNGKVVWYYRTYTPNGDRTAGKSTGCATKSAARVYCDNLIKSGQLYTGDTQKFCHYAGHFFDDNSIWMIDRMQGSTSDRPALSASYITSLRYMTRLYLLPFFGDIKLLDLTPSKTKLFRSWMLQKQLAAKTINEACNVLRIITQSAMADGLIVIDPMRTIHALPDNSQMRDAWSVTQLQHMLAAEWEKDDARLFTLTAACTGMRYSEILAIRSETLKENYIDVKDQMLRGVLSPLKTKEARKIPVPELLHQMLKNSTNPSGFYFHCGPTYYRKWFDKNCGMQTDIRAKKRLCFHSLRHFFNTYLLSENVPPVKVAAILGHSTGIGSMQERYTNWQPDMFPEVYAAQEKLLKLLTK